MQITKADGTREAFKPNKLKNSLQKAGAVREEVQIITTAIEQQLYDGMKTEEIYRKAFEMLRGSEVESAARYSLRRALFGLGPTGFPFEDFLARLFEREGYTVRKRSHIKGKCAQHEIDIAAYKDNDAFVAEAKFHSRPGTKSDLQVVMYSYARKLDLVAQRICTADHCGIRDFWVITNTKFTTTAEHYAECVGLHLLSWDYPQHNNLHDRIKATGMYPITVLQSLSNAQKRTLLERNIIICTDILKNPNRLRHLHISQKKLEAVLSEARQLGEAD